MIQEYALLIANNLFQHVKNAIMILNAKFALKDINKYLEIVLKSARFRIALPVNPSTVAKYAYLVIQYSIPMELKLA